MRSRKYYETTGAVLLSVVLCGCLSYRHGRFEELEPLSNDDTTQPTKSVAVLVSGEYHTKAGEVSVVNVMPRWENAAVKALERCGYFSEVKVGQEEADVYADIHVAETESGSLALAFISGITLLVIPSTADYEIVLTATLRDRNGLVIGTAEKTEELTQWYQILFILALPFNSTEAGVITMLTEEALKEMRLYGTL